MYISYRLSCLQRLLYSERDLFFKDMASLLAHVDFRMKLRCTYLNHSHGSETYLKRQQLLLWETGGGTRRPWSQ